MDEGVVTVVRLRGGGGGGEVEEELMVPPPFWNYTRIGEVDGTDGSAAGGGAGDDCLDHTHLNTPRYMLCAGFNSFASTRLHFC